MSLRGWMLVFFLSTVMSIAHAGTYTYTSPVATAVADDAALTWHADRNKIASAQEYFQMAMQSCVAGLVKSYEDAMQADLMMVGKQCIDSGKTFMVQIDPLKKQAKGVCQ